ncbi:MAG: tetratricopeptide repeat protein [Caldithrix sp.]|nr:MAG: tetratricopeptide repeat protein [Caldithrix sp.]
MYTPDYSSYLIAQCYFEKGEFEEAIREVRNAQNYYDEFHAHIYPNSFYLLGKIYDKKGDPQLAIQNYEKFLDLWEDADKDLPDLIDAKKRFAKLKEMSGKGS